jgi:hypothetical protein
MSAKHPYVFPYVNDIPNRLKLEYFGLQSSVLHPDDPGYMANVLFLGYQDYSTFYI